MEDYKIPLDVEIARVRRQIEIVASAPRDPTIDPPYRVSEAKRYIEQLLRERDQYIEQQRRERDQER